MAVPRTEAWVPTVLTVGVLPIAAERLAPAGVLPDRLVAMPVRALLLRKAGRAVLIDAGPGDLVRHWPGGRDLLGPALARAGVDRSAVDLVLLTHLDFDHVGGALVTVDGCPALAFPQARVAALGDGVRAARGASPSTSLDLAPTVVAALDAHGVVEELVDGEHPAPGLRVRALPGHRPGHAGFAVDTRDGPLLHAGDLFHHELHVAHPDWHDAFDSDPAAARRTRRAVTAELAASGGPCVAGHLPGDRAGRIVRAESGFAWSLRTDAPT